MSSMYGYQRLLKLEQEHTSSPLYSSIWSIVGGFGMTCRGSWLRVDATSAWLMVVHPTREVQVTFSFPSPSNRSRPYQHELLSATVRLNQNDSQI